MCLRVQTLARIMLAFLNINYKVSNCHVMSPIHREEEAASAKKSLFKETLKCRHTHMLTPRRKSFKCAEEGKGGRNGYAC